MRPRYPKQVLDRLNRELEAGLITPREHHEAIKRLPNSMDRTYHPTPTPSTEAPFRLKVHQALQGKRPLTTTQVAGVAHVARRDAAIALKALARLGLVQRTGTGGKHHPYRWALAIEEARAA